MNNYRLHFEKELEIMKASLTEEDGSLLIEDYISSIGDILDIFAEQGHSGGSAPFYANAVSNAIKNTLMFTPLSPITGADSEWRECSLGGDGVQNTRCSAVFKDRKDGEKAYYLNAIVFQGPDKYDTFSGTIGGISSRQHVKFPFTPKTFYIDVSKDPYDETIHTSVDDIVSCGDGDYVYTIKDRSQLDEVFEYYEKGIEGRKATED